MATRAHSDRQKSSLQLWRILGIAVLINALLSTVFMLSVSSTDIWFTNIKTSIFLPASLFAHFSFLFFLLALVALAAHRLRFPGNSWQLFTLIAFSTLLLVIIVDSRVFLLYKFHLNSMSLNLLFGGAAGNILSFSSSMWISIVAIVLLVFSVEFIFFRWLFRQTVYSGRRCWQAILAMMISTQLVYGYQDAIADTSITMQLRYIPWAQPLTMKKSLRKLGLIDDISSKPTLQTKKHSALNYPISPLSCQTEEKFNYLILMLDSPRSDMFNAEVMPNTHAFSQSAITFDQHWSTSNSTRFGLFGFFYGIPSTYWFDILKEQRGSVF
ncbi:MAG: DUF3413 domain-containing protein, partial [Gammaproteobacteria bacterium]|nr:DUF3413 domain-containing protein [Gammaproteobacteria bacterium]